MLTVLAVNFGSSSLKTALYTAADDPAAQPQRIARARIVRLSDGRLVIESERGRVEQHVEGDPLPAVVDALAALGLPRPDAIGHRFVHGGNYDSAQPIDAAVLTELRRLSIWAPQHQPAALMGVDQIAARWPGAQQVACFDSAFHRTMPEVAERLPLPGWLWDEGIRRFGFHGLSYQHIVDTIGAVQLGRAVITHLGNGTSATAIQDGKSVDTTMAFTPDAGLFMGSRSGDVDPGLLLYLAGRADRPLSLDDLRRLVQEQSGLRGLCGDSDMITLLGRDDPAATLALDSYCQQIAKQVGAYATVLGGLDTLVFTGGIGEHAEPIRDGITRRLAFLSIGKVLVVPTDEEAVIARQTAALIRR